MAIRSWAALASVVIGAFASLGAFAPLGILAMSPAFAQTAAIVESVRGASGGLHQYDYLAQGRSIHLADADRLVINYLHSCQREIIAGGTVTIGKEQSTVAGGSVERDKIDCDWGGHAAALGTSAKAEGEGYVAPEKPEGQPHEEGIEHTVYSVSPLFDLGGTGQLTIEPVEPAGDSMKLSVTGAELVAGRFYDMAVAGKHLVAGALYRATAHGKSVVFWVDPLAGEGATPPAGRLIPL